MIRGKRLPAMVASRASIAATGVLVVVVTSGVLGPARRGELATLQAASLVLATVISLSLWLGIAKESAREEFERGRATGLALLWGAGSIPLAAALGAVLASVAGVAHAVFLLPAATAPIVTYSIVQGLPVGLGNMPLYARADAFRAALTLAGAVLAALVFGTVAAVILAIALSFAAAALLLIMSVPRARRVRLPPREHAVERLIKPSVATHPANILGIGLLRLDIVVLAAFAAAPQVAYYSLAASFAEGAWLVPASLGMLGVSDSVRLSGPSARARTARAVRWALGFGSVTAIAIGVVGTAIVLTLLSREFRAAIAPLWISLLGAAAFSSTYATSPYLMVAERRTRLVTAMTLAAVVLDLALLAALASSHGAIGASIASTTSYTAIALGGLLVFRAGAR